MKAKIVVLSFALIAMIFAGPADAQVRDETILTYNVLSEEWHDLIGGVLDLTEAEAEGFWPIYEEYSAVKGALWNERIDVIKMFLTGYDTMGPEVARGLLGASFGFRERLMRIHQDGRGYAYICFVVSRIDVPEDVAFFKKTSPLYSATL